jgi:hypothetical protein
MIKLDFPTSCTTEHMDECPCMDAKKPPPWMNKKLDSHPSERVD